jgi:hypothetical protein
MSGSETDGPTRCHWKPDHVQHEIKDDRGS